MRKLSLESQILAAFYENAKNKNEFMDCQDIGIAIFGNGYINQTASIFDKMIRERIYKVREIAEQQGILIIAKRKATIKDKTKKFKILGWKIATSGDEPYIVDELLYKIKNGDAKTKSTKRFIDCAVKQNMIEEKKVLELTR